MYVLVYCSASLSVLLSLFLGWAQKQGGCVVCVFFTSRGRSEKKTIDIISRVCQNKIICNQSLTPTTIILHCIHLKVYILRVEENAQWELAPISHDSYHPIIHKHHIKILFWQVLTYCMHILYCFYYFLADCTSYTAVLLYTYCTVSLTSTMHNTTHSTHITSTQWLFIKTDSVTLFSYFQTLLPILERH